MKKKYAVDVSADGENAYVRTLATPVPGVTSIEVVHATVPVTEPVVNDDNRDVDFTINGSSHHVTLDKGNPTGAEIAVDLLAKVNGQVAGALTAASYATATGTFTIAFDVAVTTASFDFATNAYTSAAPLLGFVDGADHAFDSPSGASFESPVAARVAPPAEIVMTLGDGEDAFDHVDCDGYSIFARFPVDVAWGETQVYRARDAFAQRHVFYSGARFLLDRLEVALHKVRGDRLQPYRFGGGRHHVQLSIDGHGDRLQLMEGYGESAKLLEGSDEPPEYKEAYAIERADITPYVVAALVVGLIVILSYR